MKDCSFYPGIDVVSISKEVFANYLLYNTIFFNLIYDCCQGVVVVNVDLCRKTIHIQSVIAPEQKAD